MSRYYQSELISMLAVTAFPHCGGSPEKAVEASVARAIAIYEHAQRECERLNEQVRAREDAETAKEHGNG